MHKKRQHKYKLGSINIHFLLYLNSKNCDQNLSQFLILPPTCGRGKLLITEIGLAKMVMIFLSYFCALLGVTLTWRIYLTNFLINYFLQIFWKNFFFDKSFNEFFYKVFFTIFFDDEINDKFFYHCLVTSILRPLNYKYLVQFLTRLGLRLGICKKK